MTLLEFLQGLEADPSEYDGPTLIVAEGRLSDAQREQVIGASYNRRPYAVIAYRSRPVIQRLHNHAKLMLGAADINLYHPPNGLTIPDGTVLANLQADVRDAESMVTEISDGYNVAGLVKVVTEVDPHPDPDSKLGGLRAVTRITIPIWR